MDKYLCICGVSFNRKKLAKNHIDLYKDSHTVLPHHLMKRPWKVRFYDILLSYPWYKIPRLAAVYIIMKVIEYHFNITFDIAESIWIAVAIGLLV